MWDQRRGGRCRENAALADHDAAEAVGDGYLGDDLDRLAIEETAVAARDQRLALETLERVEDRLDVILEVARLPEDGNLFAQARRARLLIGERLGGDGSDHRWGSPRRAPVLGAFRPV